uniref:Uncharacterized protein n=1 Tax=Lepeophtheirus salmonis TaxID=72036 RepID=A0A0K2UCV4_LEPSM
MGIKIYNFVELIIRANELFTHGVGLEHRKVAYLSMIWIRKF